MMVKEIEKSREQIEVNFAYCWFFGLELRDRVPHFTTFGKNYTRRFADTDLFEQMDAGYSNPAIAKLVLEDKIEPYTGN